MHEREAQKNNYNSTLKHKGSTREETFEVQVI
jgi:hypothetical protein